MPSAQRMSLAFQHPFQASRGRGDGIILSLWPSVCCQLPGACMRICHVLTVKVHRQRGVTTAPQLRVIEYAVAPGTLVCLASVHVSLIPGSVWAISWAPMYAPVGRFDLIYFSLLLLFRVRGNVILTKKVRTSTSPPHYSPPFSSGVLFPYVYGFRSFRSFYWPPSCHL